MMISGPAPMTNVDDTLGTSVMTLSTLYYHVEQMMIT